MNTRARLAKRVTFIIGSILAFAYVTPFLLVFLNSVKLKPEILENPLSLPVSITWENFQEALTKMNFFRSLTNSIIISVLSVSLLIVFSSMLAYYLARNKNKFTKYIFLILVTFRLVTMKVLTPLSNV